MNRSIGFIGCGMESEQNFVVGRNRFLYVDELKRCRWTVIFADDSFIEGLLGFRGNVPDLPRRSETEGIIEQIAKVGAYPGYATARYGKCSF